LEKLICGVYMKKILDRINSSDDVKKLNIPELEALATEIREFLVGNISKCGGHLSSNLGTVELTLALHKVFDFSRDKVVWDVGHQAYTHKIVTGRRDSFSSLRQKDGISGFPKTSESETDTFNTGHSSTSISAALGFAKAIELNGSDAFAVAVIGDGALTGGMAYEALNHAGSGSTPLIIVLNDNGMSISQNVGGISNYLEKISSDARYITLKVRVKKFLKNLPVLGKPFRWIMHRGKRFLKMLLVQKKLFENMGLEYLGPVDGHDFKDLITAFEYAKTYARPVIVHAITKKGRGYTPSEEDPCSFHGISAFDPNTGEFENISKNSFSDIFGDEIVKLARDNPKILAITAAMPHGTGLDRFAAEFPHRFFDVGIAEQHAVTFSAALAKSGFVPVFAVYSTFLQRGYDQILHDVALQNLHAVFAIDRAGAVGNDGETHQGIYDLSYLSHIPNMTIMAPCCGDELREMLQFAVDQCKSPVAIRYPKGCSGECDYGLSPIQYGKGVILREGSDVLIVGIGSSVNDALNAANILEDMGISVAVMNARFLKPFDEDLFRQYASRCRLVATVEDNTKIGGLYAAAKDIYDGNILKFAFPDEPLAQGTVLEQKQHAKIDSISIAKEIQNVIGDYLG
jgi:1-deoxy-D-xylulose-5-phosphate synthase